MQMSCVTLVKRRKLLHLSKNPALELSKHYEVEKPEDITQ